ncbi:hypothetical protein GGR56DRAFT_675747 [Xylariaceae sp. FL0804]|nr:hypothetical protein GGR56DRAFT_675747 [Xylariaceae sp. FL0804]
MYFLTAIIIFLAGSAAAAPAAPAPPAAAVASSIDPATNGTSCWRGTLHEPCEVEGKHGCTRDGILTVCDLKMQRWAHGLCHGNLKKCSYDNEISCNASC